jgi:uncharacterized membrane protein YtjA (UPF0391 family)
VGFAFLIVALIAGALGFTGVAGAAIGVAKFLFFLFLVLFVAFLVLGATIFKRCRGPNPPPQVVTSRTTA